MQSLVVDNANELVIASMLDKVIRTYDLDLGEAIHELVKTGLIVVCAAGNQAIPVFDPLFPRLQTVGYHICQADRYAD